MLAFLTVPIVVHWAAAQALVKATRLQHLTMCEGCNGHNIELLAATPLPSLHSLYIPYMDLSNARFLTGCTQLQELSLGYMYHVKGVSALAQLTGLTSLKLSGPHATIGAHQQFAPEQQSELGSFLAALKGLRILDINFFPSGPVTQAVSQLTALTELILHHMDVAGNPGPVVLPSALSLRSCGNYVTPKHLADITAPQLLHLEAGMVPEPGDLNTLRLLCRGTLRAASILRLDLQNKWSKEDTATLMAMLYQSWQASAQALCAAADDTLKREHGTCSSSSSSNARERELAVWRTCCSRQCLSLVSNALTRLKLM
jgi:hypothetical protein